MQYPWGHQRRFNAYSEYFKKHVGQRVQKLTIDAGFSCPNRDGTITTGGCTYCNNNAFSPSYCTPDKSISQQLSEGIDFHKKRYRRANKYLAYFQAYSNTHAPLATLTNMYEEALRFPEVTGLVIGTRPDCIDNEKLDYFSQLSEKHYIIIEFGVESVFNHTLQRINRGHTFETSVRAIEATHKRGIKTGAHMIVGLPGESENDLLQSVQIMSQLPLDTIKFHQLQIVKNTVMEKQYAAHPNDFKLFTLSEYIQLITSMIELLNPSFVVERIAGEVPPKYLATEGWGKLRVYDMMHMFEKNLEMRNTWQGRLYK